MHVRFEISGEPKGKERPRFHGKGNPHTPDDTAVYENLVKIEYKRQCGVRFADDAMLKVLIKAYYSIPKSTGKAKRNAMLMHDIRPTKRPDVDNIEKVVFDALNGIAFRDDAQIVDCYVRKYYADIPKVVVSIRD